MNASGICIKVGVVAVGIFLPAVLQSAYADAVGNVRWCESNTASPASVLAMAAIAPDGKPRGTRSAAVLIGEARAAARRGDCNKAIEWALLCQWHNEGPQNEIRNDRESVCNYLK